MATIVYQTNKKTGVVYAYRSVSFRDPVTRKPTSRRTYLGRVDPVTKQIIEKAESGKRNRSKIQNKEDIELSLTEARERIAEQERQIKALQEKVDVLTQYYKKTSSNMNALSKIVVDIQSMKVEI